MSTRIIKINRGDTFEFDLIIPDKNKKLKATDAVYFALCYPHQNFADAILLKGYKGNDPEINIETGIITIRLEHSDTELLEPGIYYYTVKLHIGGSLEDLGATSAPDEVHTIIERTKFIINE